jgi:hypothetical protein
MCIKRKDVSKPLREFYRQKLKKKVHERQNIKTISISKLNHYKL